MLNEFIRKCLTATFGGLFGIIASHPFDTVKVRLQTMGAIDYGFGEHLYEGPMDCFKKMIRREGVLSLYSGMSVTLVSNIPITLITFLGYEFGKKLLQTNTDNVTYGELFVIGSITGASPSLIVTPTELIKLKLQTPNTFLEYEPDKPMDIVRRIYRKYGVFRLVKGNVLTMLRDVPATGLYFVTYEFLFDKLTPNHIKISGEPEYYRTAFCGGIAGCLFWLLATPVDFVKTRYQTAPTKHNVSISTIVDQILQEAGHGFKSKVRLLYTGFNLVLARAFLSHAAIFIGYDIYKHLTMSKTLIELYKETKVKEEASEEMESFEDETEEASNDEDPTIQDDESVEVPVSQLSGRGFRF